MVVLDSLAQAEAVTAASKADGAAIPALIEIDADGHRSGLRPGDPMIVAVGRALVDGGAELRGVVTHAGESYGADGDDAIAAFAEQERLAAVTAADALRAAGLPCPIISVGSSPTAHFARDLSGVTEVRAGVYMFFDLVMAGLGVCRMEDIAMSVLTTVIGHQQERGWTIVDAGWLAMSRDRGTAGQKVDQGYGAVCDIDGRMIDDLIMISANQEHGIIASRSDGRRIELPVGTRLRILPNHACATAAAFEAYNVIPQNAAAPMVVWSRFNGW